MTEINKNREELMKVLAFNLKPESLEDLHKVNNKWLYLEAIDYEYFESAYSCAIDRHVPGDPIWMYLIAPPGGMKTTVAKALKTSDKIYTIDSLTKHTFISGLARKDKITEEMTPIAGILKDLDGKVVVIKDFTTILSKQKEDRNEIYGQLRSIYDGYFELAFGTMKEKISVEAHIGLIVCVTPIIDKYTVAHNLLGERFLKIRQHPNKRETVIKSRQNLGKEKQMDIELSQATAHYLRSLKPSTKNPTLTEEQDELILNISLLLAAGRAPVMCKYYQGQIVGVELAEPEIATRLIKQLTKFAKCLAIIRQHENVENGDIETVKRIVRDTMEQKRWKILQALAEIEKENKELDVRHQIKPNAYQIGKIAKIHHNTVSNECEKMKALEMITETESLGYAEGTLDIVPLGSGNYLFTPETKEYTMQLIRGKGILGKQKEEETPKLEPIIKEDIYLPPQRVAHSDDEKKFEDIKLKLMKHLINTTFLEADFIEKAVELEFSPVTAKEEFEKLVGKEIFIVPGGYIWSI